MSPSTFLDATGIARTRRWIQSGLGASGPPSPGAQASTGPRAGREATKNRPSRPLLDNRDHALEREASVGDELSSSSPSRRRRARSRTATRGARAKQLRHASPSILIYFVDVQFSTDEHCDEGRLPWDHFGAQVWEVERG
jgi:hypothetical protein